MGCEEGGQIRSAEPVVEGSRDSLRGELVAQPRIGSLHQLGNSIELANDRGIRCPVTYDDTTVVADDQRGRGGRRGLDRVGR